MSHDILGLDRYERAGITDLFQLWVVQSFSM